MTTSKQILSPPPCRPQNPRGFFSHYALRCPAGRHWPASRGFRTSADDSLPALMQRRLCPAANYARDRAFFAMFFRTQETREDNDVV
jgi:hypothetical protein